MISDLDDVAGTKESGSASVTATKPAKVQNLVLGDISNNAPSLQESFKKFMQQKKKERQILKLAKNGEFVGGKRTDEFKQALRMKFIETAKRYLGVPYAERFKAPEAPVAPLYLDCCGLVRQVVKDLQEDFGFVLGRWNQAYQMDTLPMVLEQHELKPGDLIFYEGIYNSKRSKPQKHNNVHVEIFLGGETGEATIGSRYHRGVVSIFPSFKFKSTTWDLVQYHFRSLDTWLNGECRSHCPEHPWQSDLLGLAAAAGKRSIFNSDSEGESAGGSDCDDCDDCDDHNAAPEDGDDDDDDTDEIGGGGSGGESDATNTGDKSNTNTGTEGSAAADSETVSAPRIPAALTSTSAVTTPTASPLRVHRPPLDGSSASKGKKSKRISQCRASSGDISVAKNGNGLLASPLRSTSPEPALIVKGTRRSASNSVNSSVNSSAGGGAVVGARVRRSKSSSVDAAATSTEEASLKKHLPHTYYVCKSNGWKLVKDALDKRGWQQLPFEYNFSSRFGLKWVERRSHIDYKSHIPGQLVNHIANNDVITTKTGLLTALREKYCRAPLGSAVRIPTPWLPETYELESPADFNAAVEADAEAAKLSPTGEGCLWIYKPSSYNRGRGIRVVRGKEALEELWHGKKTDNPDTTIPPSKGIVQRYIENPLLVGPDGFKFDVRCYMLVARNDPSYLVYYHPGYCRLSLKPYSTAAETLEDPTVHLTNASIQKKDPIYEANKENQIRTIEAVAANVEEHGNAAAASFMRNNMDDAIMRCMVDVIKSATSKFMRKKGYFDLFGFDFMVTSDSQLKLIEVNTNPALSLDNAVLENLLPGVIDGTIDLVLRSQGPDRPADATDESLSQAGIGKESQSQPPNDFRLIYDESLGFEYTGTGNDGGGGGSSCGAKLV